MPIGRPLAHRHHAICGKSSKLASVLAIVGRLIEGDIEEQEREEVIKQESSVVVYQNQITVDSERAPAALPRPVTSLLEDFVMVRD